MFHLMIDMPSVNNVLFACYYYHYHYYYYYSRCVSHIHLLFFHNFYFCCCCCSRRVMSMFLWNNFFLSDSVSLNSGQSFQLSFSLSLHIALSSIMLIIECPLDEYGCIYNRITKKQKKKNVALMRIPSMWICCRLNVCTCSEYKVENRRTTCDL